RAAATSLEQRVVRRGMTRDDVGEYVLPVHARIRGEIEAEAVQSALGRHRDQHTFIGAATLGGYLILGGDVELGRVDRPVEVDVATGNPERAAGEIERPATRDRIDLPEEVHITTRLLLHLHAAFQLDIRLGRLTPTDPHSPRKTQVDVETGPTHERWSLLGILDDGRPEVLHQVPHVVGRQLDMFDLGGRRLR